MADTVNTVKMTLEMPPELNQTLERISEEMGTTKSEVVRRVLAFDGNGTQLAMEDVRQTRWLFNAMLLSVVTLIGMSAYVAFFRHDEAQKLGADLLKLLATGSATFLLGRAVARAGGSPSVGLKESPKSSPPHSEVSGLSSLSSLTSSLVIPASWRNAGRVKALAGVGVLAVVAVFTLYALFSGPTPAPSPSRAADANSESARALPPPPMPKADAAAERIAPPPPPPASITLRLQSTPSGAEVYEGDLWLGIAPLEVSRPVDSVLELKFTRDGYKPQMRKVRFVSDQALSVSLEHDVPIIKRRAPSAPAATSLPATALSSNPYEADPGDDLKPLPE